MLDFFIQGKTCKKCNIYKSYENFTMLKKRRGYRPHCNDCLVCKECPEIKIFSTFNALVSHDKWVHNPVLLPCNYPGCNVTCKRPWNLRNHKAMCHGENTRWFTCDVEDCTHRTKQVCDLNAHKAGFHDIGNKTCGICKKENIGVTYEHDGVEVCRNCCKEYHLRKTRIEVRYVNAIRKHFEFPMDHDQTVKGSACTKYRPDLLWLDANRKLFLHVEIDEHQHSWSSGDYSCDERRISEIYDEFKQVVPEHYIIIRFNPDAYGDQPVKGTRDKVFEKRKKKLLEVIRNVIESPPTDLIHIIYMYYDRTNSRIARSIPHSFVE